MTYLTLSFRASPEEANLLHRDLATWFDNDDRLRRVTRLAEAPPDPGKLGGLATAVELLTATAPVLNAAIGAFGYWLGQRSSGQPITFTATLPDGNSRSFSADRRNRELVMREYAAFVNGQQHPPADSGDSTA